MKENKKELLEKVSKLTKKGHKFENMVVNLALQRLDSDNFKMEGNLVYSSDGKRLVYILGDDTEVTLIEGTEVIGEMAAAKKKKLSSITLPHGLKKIERDAFVDCDSLRTVNIPASVEEIEAYAFADCDNLKSVVFEGIPKSLNRKAFAECERLHDISVPAKGVKAVRKALHFTDGDTDFIVVGRPENTQDEETVATPVYADKQGKKEEKPADKAPATEQKKPKAKTDKKK